MVRRAPDERSRTGAWYTPDHLVDLLVAASLDNLRTPTATVRVIDPACGDGRLLAAVISTLEARGLAIEAVGCEIDPPTARATRERLGSSATIIEGDALEHPWARSDFDLVIANPPFSSPLSKRGPTAITEPGSPYADLATRFWDLALELIRPEHGRIALILPQSILSSRDAENVRRHTESTCRLLWSWWSETPAFDAQITVCSVVFERSQNPKGIDWTGIVTDRLGLPPLPSRLSTSGTIAERARIRANFRDEYYGLAGCVTDTGSGPPLITSGLIDPGTCHWGRRTTRFAKQRFQAPRVDMDCLSDRFHRWAKSTLAPKVLVATQTRVLEAVSDPDGSWVPAVPVVRLEPLSQVTPDEIAALLTSPIASRLMWSQSAGTGLSPKSLRVGVAGLSDLPWPAGGLRDAAEALNHGDIAACGRLVHRAFDITEQGSLTTWWEQHLPGRVE